jgi:hypothetical protein
MGLALVAMKAPPVTREYQAALLLSKRTPTPRTRASLHSDPSSAGGDNVLDLFIDAIRHDSRTRCAANNLQQIVRSRLSNSMLESGRTTPQDYRE